MASEAMAAEKREREALIQRKATLYGRAVTAYVAAFPDLLHAPLTIVRCPARVNLRGMHIDSHGGGCNALAIPMETLLLFHPHRAGTPEEHTFVIKNANLAFPEVVIDSTRLQRDSGWSRYLVGVLEGLTEQHNQGRPLRGFSGLITSDVPTGAGISSSHSLVLAFMSGCLLANPEVALDPIQIIEMARTAEGKAGAVTGLADQGAMLFGREGHILHTCFYQNDHSAIRPAYAPFPPGHVVVVVDSLKARNLSGKEAANYAVPRFAYSVALGLFTEVMRRAGYGEELVQRIDRLSRISPEELGEPAGTAAIYRLLLQIPARITTHELVTQFPSLREVAEKAEQTYLCKLRPEMKPAHLELRGPLLFGIAECARAREFFRLLHVCAYASTPSQRDQALLDMGRVMTIGHMGDSPKYADEHPISDAYLQGLVDKLEADPADPSAQFYAQPGAFNASVPEMDELQRILCAHGALGASLTGAGMGGVVVGIVRADRVAALKAAVEAEYHGPRRSSNDGAEGEDNSDPRRETFFVCVPISGVGALELPSEDHSPEERPA